LILAKFLIPAIVTLLRDRYLAVGVYGNTADDWHGLATESETILRGK